MSPEEQRYREIHDDIVRCTIHLQLRGLGDARQNMIDFLLENPAFVRSAPHAKDCPACDYATKILEGEMR